jgi:hypothetical protein
MRRFALTEVARHRAFPLRIDKKARQPELPLNFPDCSLCASLRPALLTALLPFLSEEKKTKVD